MIWNLLHHFWQLFGAFLQTVFSTQFGLYFIGVFVVFILFCLSYQFIIKIFMGR